MFIVVKRSWTGVLWILKSHFRDFPPTFRGVHGIITYNLAVTIYRPWHMSKSFVTELMFMNQMNLNQPELWVRDSDSLNSLIFPQKNIAFICGVIPKCCYFNKMFRFVCSVLSREPTARLCAACGVPQDPSPWLPLQRKKSLPQVFLPFTLLQVCLAKKNKNNHPVSSSCRRNCKNSLRNG